jgi:AraC family transcriptional regulator, regulatory protein of adaptative response / DNA-3-methyladenine glycosylase II
MTENRQSRGPKPRISERMDMNHDVCYRILCQRDARFDGRLFTGVKTTGIYCRPICPARTPFSKNVTFFPTAAAAQEAGFRPCLRCRPESAPDLGAWRGTSNTVSRALSLIEQGALDEGDVAELASRLGVAERQLRRLFKQHLGASPIAVAQTRRVLLAKQLIHETRLPMTEIAFASGFGSVRRFNETFQALYHRPPGELRRSSAVDLTLANQSSLEIALPYRPPYDWDAMIDFLTVRAISGVEQVIDGVWTRVIAIDGAQGTVTVRPGKPGRLLASIRFPVLTALPKIIARLRRVFDLSADPTAIGACLSSDETLAPLVAARPGLRAPGAWDGFELAIRAVLGQQITLAAAAKLAGRLAKEYGEPLKIPFGTLTHAFPTARALSQAQIEGGMPASRARTVTAMARAVLAQPDILETASDLDDAIRRLVAIPGVGPWTASYIALRQLREPDAFPAADVGLMKAMADEAGIRPTAIELEARSQAWRPWRAYAAQHLWTSLC